MLVLGVWAGAVLVVLLVGGVLGYEVSGHVRRLLQAVAAAETELRPQVDELASRLARLKPPARVGGTGGGGAGPGSRVLEDG